MRTGARCAALLVFGATSLGCGAKLDGDWDGEVDIVSIAADLKMKGPVHVHVAGDTFTIVGAPFSKCAVKLEKVRGTPTLHFEGGNCSILGGKPPKTFALPDGFGWATPTGDDLSVGSYPPASDAPKDGTADVVFQVHAKRAKK